MSARRARSTSWKAADSARSVVIIDCSPLPSGSRLRSGAASGTLVAAGAERAGGGGGIAGAAQVEDRAAHGGDAEQAVPACGGARAGGAGPALVAADLRRRVAPLAGLAVVADGGGIAGGA